MSHASRDIPEQVRDKVTVDVSTGCWEWMGARSDGYGRLRVAGQTPYAHRYVYMLLVGPVPDGRVLDHKCNNRACVNPDHLDVVAQKENVQRGRLPGLVRARQLAKTACPAGHPYADTNLYSRPDGRRACRACRHEQDRLRRSQEEKKAA
jgi:hypothetical protein